MKKKRKKWISNQKNKGKRYSTLMAKPSINIFDDENELGFVQSIN